MGRYLLGFWKKYKVSLMACLAVILLYLLMSVVGIGCPVKYITGISCPGCGMTRACLSAMRLDLESAFAYHPLWVALPPVAFLLILFRARKNNKAAAAVLYVSVFVMLLVYIYRLIFTDSDVVVFLPEEGAVYRLIQKLTALFTHEG